MAILRTVKRRPIQYVPPFDYAGFPLEEIRPALLHMRDLGQALYDLREIVDSGSDEVRRRVQPILDERSDFADDIVEIGLGHLEDEAGFLRHVHILGDLSPDQEARVAVFQQEFDEHVDILRREAEAIQDQWRRARIEYYRR